MTDRPLTPSEAAWNGGWNMRAAAIHLLQAHGHAEAARLLAALNPGDVNRQAERAAAQFPSQAEPQLPLTD